MAANGFTPVALAVQKRGRLCIVAKITRFIGDSAPILAVAWRNQPGTRDAISLPTSVIEYAERVGVTNFFLRNDKTITMHTCSLAAFHRGRLGADNERYVPLAWLRAVPWRDWRFATQVVHIADLPEMGSEKIEQLALEF
jgi:hypothetical protein